MSIMEQSTLEKWESVTRGTVWINKWDRANPGAEKKERIQAGRSFYITAEERNLLNSERTLDDSLDPFKNGFLRPTMTDAAASAAEEEARIRAEAQAAAAPNPNHMSDGELAALYAIRNFPQFKSAVSKITSVAILGRLRNLGHVEENQATIAQINLIEQLIADRSTGPVVAEVEQLGRVGQGMEGDDQAVGLQPFKI